MIQFACIGTGWITASFVESAHATGSWRAVAVYSRRAETATEFATKQKLQDCAIHTSIDELAADGNVQAVYIASPNSHHYEHAKAMLRASKHVIIEKPATSTTAELDELFQLAKSGGVFLLEANRHLQEINFKVLQANLPRLGPIFGASLNYASYSSRYNNVLNGETPNIFSLEYSGGSLVDLAVYPISMAVALFGQPQSQTYKPVIIATGADGGGLVTLNYETFGVSINASKIYTSTAPSEVYGQNGTLTINAVTDIDRVTYLDAKSKTTEQSTLR